MRPSVACLASVAAKEDSPPAYAEITDTIESKSRRSSTNSIPEKSTVGERLRRYSSASNHPRLAVELGVQPVWFLPLLICRALAVAPATWWGLRYAFISLGELLFAADGTLDSVSWSVEKRFRVTEVFLAVVWCIASGYLSYFFTDCLMGRWLSFYTPGAAVVRMLTINALIAYISSWVLWLSGASGDSRMLLPAWISISTIMTGLYHITQRKINIKRETRASINVLSIASFITMCSLLWQLHLSRENDPVIPFFVGLKRVWEMIGSIG